MEVAKNNLKNDHIPQLENQGIAMYIPQHILKNVKKSRTGCLHAGGN